MSNTKIVATLGPSTGTAPMISSLIDEGVDVVRLNASHGSKEEHLERIGLIRQSAAQAGRHVGILLDLQGPKIRLGTFAEGSVQLETGAEFTLHTEPVVGTAAAASSSYTGLARDVKPGDRILIADGTVALEVLSSDGVSARCRVTTGGMIGDRKGINLPGVAVSTPSLTRKDMTDLQWALEAGVDMVALSFVRRSSDILRLRLYLEEKGANIPIIAKIEKPEAVDNLDDILKESDGVMVARGDLGVEMALERVPFIQKSIIERARLLGKFVITATQMLESMVQAPTPTRAEVSDVANAIYDGTDAVMLSAETSTGLHPIEAARMMDRIAREAETNIRRRGFRKPPEREHMTHAEIVAESAYFTARMAAAAAIVVFTSSGSTARLVARYRPPVPIFAFTASEGVARQLTVVYGVTAIIAGEVPSTDEMLALMDRTLVQQGNLKPRDSVVFVAGQPIGRPGSTNLMKLHRVGEGR
jgi:pyruvate kinase